MNTLATRKQSQAIRDRMQSIRNELPYAMDEARHELKQLSDWKYYVRKAPLTAVACTALAAYAVVPSSKASARRPKTEADSLEPNDSFWSGLIGAAAAMAMRTGTSLALQKVSAMLGGIATQRPGIADGSGRNGNGRSMSLSNNKGEIQ